MNGHAHSFQLLFIHWWRGSSLETYGIYNTFSRNNEYLLTFLIEKTLRNTVFFSFWSFASASQLKKQTKVCEVVCVVRSCTYFLVPVLHVGYVRYYTALSQFVKFVEDHVRLLECSPVSCLATRYHCEEKRKKFITCRINNKSPSLFGFDTVQAQCWILKSRREHLFFIWVNEK